MTDTEQEYEMREQEQSELLSRLLKLSAEEDAISTLDDKSFLQPWEYPDEALSEAMERLKKLGLENPSLQHLTQAAYSCYAEHQKRRSISETEKAAYSKPRVSIFIPGRGWYYLSDVPDSETGKAISYCVTDNILGGLTGTSKITFCGGIHFKFKPKKPGIEYAIHALDSLLFPDQAVTNPSLFIKLRFMSDNGVKEEEALATQTVYGTTADKFEENSLQFDQAHFTQQCILQLLTAPGDGKLDNFIISENKLFGIDNEMAFEPEIVKGEGRKGHITFIHTFLFFLPQMKNCLDQNLIQQFKILSAEKLFLVWLKELEVRNNLYERLDRNNLKIIFDEGILKAVYFRLKRIQLFFKEIPSDEMDKITGENLFKEVMPEVFSYYEAINEHLHDQPLQKKIEALQKTKRGDEKALNFEILNVPFPISDKIVTEYRLKVTEIYRQTKQVPKTAEENPIPEETLKQAIENMANWLNLSQLSESEKNEFYNELSRGDSHIQKLELKDEALTGPKLLSLAKGSTLSYLYLESTQVKLADLKKLMSFPDCAGMEICLGENIHLGLESWQYLLHSPLCSHFSLKLPNGEIILLKGKNILLDQLSPGSYLQALSHQKRNEKNQNRTYFDAIEKLLIQEGYPIKSFEACLSKQSDQTASRFIVSSLRYLIMMLENRETSPERYLNYYLKLDKSWRQVFYQQISQEISNKSRCQKIQKLIGKYPDSDGERRLSSLREQEFRQKLSYLVEYQNIQQNLLLEEKGKESKSIISTKAGIKKSIPPKTAMLIEGITPGKACLDNSLTTNLTSEGWLTEDNFNFKHKKEKLDKDEEKEFKINFIENLHNSEKVTSSVQHGNHLVIPIEYKDSKVHCKVLPDFPGIEIAYSLLSSRIMGKGSPQVELWKWTYGQHTYPVLVSETIEGENLTPELLKAYPLEEISYQQHVLMAMLVNPGDGNPGNFIAEKIKASDGSMLLRLVSIDNDRLFAPPFETGKLRTATIIYCFDEIASPLHKDLRQVFLSLNAYEVLSWWLNTLETLNQQYCEIFTPEELKKFMSGELENTSSYLLTMLKRDTVSELFRKIKTIQYWLDVQPQMTLIDLLSKVQPSLANHYQQMRVQYDNPIRRFEEAVKNEYRREEIQGVKRYTSTMHMGQYLKMQGREVNAEKTVEKYWQQDFVQAKKELRDLSVSLNAIESAKLQLIHGNIKGFNELTEAYAQEEVIANMDFSKDVRNSRGKPDEKRQHEIILLIISGKNLKSLERLIIQHCAITDEQLEQFLKRLPKLRILKLTNCSNIKTTFQETLFDSGKLYSKVLEECILQDMKGITGFKLTSHILRYLSIKQTPNLKAFYCYSDSLTQLRLSDAPQCNEFDIYAKDLQEADFSGNILMNDIHLQKIVLECQNLKQMNLQRCDEKKISYLSLKEVIPAFAEKVAQNEKDEEYLKASSGELSLIVSNKIDALDMKKNSGWFWKCCCVALVENTSIKEISYFQSYDTTDRMLFVGMIEKNQTVVTLEITLNNMGDDLAVAWAKALKYNHTIRAIDFSMNKIGDEGAIAFAQTLECNHTITRINFDMNYIRNKGAIALANSLKQNQTLRGISLAQNEIGDKGALALHDMLKNTGYNLHLMLWNDNVLPTKEKLSKLKKTPLLIKLNNNHQGLFYIYGNSQWTDELVKLKSNEALNKLSFNDKQKLYISATENVKIYEEIILKGYYRPLNIEFGGNSISASLRSALCSSKWFQFERDEIDGTIGPYAFKASGIINVVRPLMWITQKIMNVKYSSEGVYSSNNFKLNPFTFFSEHADRENALCYTQNHQEQLELHLKKALEIWEIPAKVIEDSKKKNLELKQTAQVFGFKCIPISKDGNCLFEAVSAQVEKILPNQKEHYNHEELRNLAVNYLMEQQGFYENFVEDHSFTNFIRKMSLSGTWAENTALNALAHILNVTIVVINSDSSQPIILKKPHARGIIYLGYEVNSHYQSLERDLQINPQKNIQTYINDAELMEEPQKISAYTF